MASKMNRSHYKTIEYNKWTFLYCVCLIECLHHDIDDIERQNLMRDVKIDQMLFFKDGLPYFACISLLCYEYQIQNEKEKNSTHISWHTDTFTYTRIWCMSAAKPA